MAYKHLFSPIKIRGLELKNRVAMPGMATKMAKDKYVTDQLINYHLARVKGGLGLNIVEATAVHEPSSAGIFLSLGDDKYIPKMKELTDAVHKAGGKIGIQLWQGGPVASLLDPSAFCFSPSEMKMSIAVLGGTELVFPEASVETIKEIVAAFGDAAARAEKAGFDCVEFHLAHGYSPHMFLSGAINRRTDAYGGSFEKRAEFPLECIDAIRANISKDMPLFMRVSAHDDNLENGITIDEMIRFCNMAKVHGVDAVDVSRGNSYTAGLLEGPPLDFPRGFNADNAAKIKAGTGLVTLAVGRINNADLAEDLIASGKVDMVIMGRTHLADPEFCNKASSGREEDIVYCIGCNQGCNDIIAAPNLLHITCTRNPAVGREAEYALKKTTTPKKVLIAGGGMAGMEAAFVLKARGHEPILCEAANTLGGQFILAGKAPRKEEMELAVKSRADQVRRAGIEIRLSAKVTPELIAEISPDVFINATGASPVMPAIPGIDADFVWDYASVLSGKVTPHGNVVVIGGGGVGLEVADLLAEKGCAVTVVEMLDNVGKDVGAFRLSCLMESLAKGGVKFMTKAKCAAISAGKVTVEKDGQKEPLACDSVVIAVGSAANKADLLENACSKSGIAYYVAGDAKKSRNALEAIAESAEVARGI